MNGYLYLLILECGLPAFCSLYKGFSVLM